MIDNHVRCGLSFFLWNCQLFFQQFRRNVHYPCRSFVVPECNRRRASVQYLEGRGNTVALRREKVRCRVSSLTKTGNQTFTQLIRLRSLVNRSANDISRTAKSCLVGHANLLVSGHGTKCFTIIILRGPCSFHMIRSADANISETTSRVGHGTKVVRLTIIVGRPNNRPFQAGRQGNAGHPFQTSAGQASRAWFSNRRVV